MMRTTMNIPDDVYEVVRSHASLKRISLGTAVAELVRQGLSWGYAIDEAKPFPCFDLPDTARPITLEQTLQAEDEL